MGSAIIHVDMDAFYASVEQRDHPHLRGQPVIVGGRSKRGVVCAASYEVRKFGVRSAMPMVEAMRRAPHAIVVEPNFAAYAEASEQVFEIFNAFTPLVEGLSLDEAFLDVTASQTLFGEPATIAQAIRTRIANEVHLAASAGIANVKFVAKICSDLAKPNGQKLVRENEVRSFLSPLPIGRLWGVGAKTEQRLLSLGLKTLGDVAAREPRWLKEYLGDSGQHLWELSQGIDERQVQPDREAKSVGSEETFNDNLTDREHLAPRIHAHAFKVASRLRRTNTKARVVVLKVKKPDFTLLTRRVTLPSPTDDGQTVYRHALALFDAMEREPLRLIGVAVADFGDGPARQMGLFADPKKEDTRRNDQLNRVMDRIHEKFGRHAVTTLDLANAKDDRDTARGAADGSRTDLEEIQRRAGSAQSPSHKSKSKISTGSK